MRPTRRFVLGFGIAILAVVAVAAFLASSAPDGLEKVASDTGLVEREEAHALRDSPLADYGVRGMDDGGTSRLVAGAIGTVLTFAAASLVTKLVARRRGHREVTQN